MNKFLTFMTVLGMLTLTSGVSFSEDYQHCNAFRQTAEGVAGLRDAGVSRLNAKTMVRDVLVKENAWTPASEGFFF